MGSHTHKRILEDVLPLRIIREVEKWPVIYKKDSPEMTNPHFKFKIWEEIAKSLFDTYHIYSEIEKEQKVYGLMKKWRNLRDTFKRQLMVEKKVRQGHAIKKKEYVYFKHMSFLLPHMTDEQPAGGALALRRARRAHRQHAPAPHLPHAAHALDDIDEDRHFLLSLLPSLKRMSDDEKLTVKMEILKVIKDVKNSSTPMALGTFVDDSLALPDAPDAPHAPHAPADDAVVVKKELFTVDLADYKLPSDSASCDTE